MPAFTGSFSQSDFSDLVVLVYRPITGIVLKYLGGFIWIRVHQRNAIIATFRGGLTLTTGYTGPFIALYSSFPKASWKMAMLINHRRKAGDPGVDMVVSLSRK